MNISLQLNVRETHILSEKTTYSLKINHLRCQSFQLNKTDLPRSLLFQTAFTPVHKRQITEINVQLAVSKIGLATQFHNPHISKTHSAKTHSNKMHAKIHAKIHANKIHNTNLHNKI